MRPTARLLKGEDAAVAKQMKKTEHARQYVHFEKILCPSGALPLCVFIWG
jgi:hypothetical protein